MSTSRVLDVTDWHVGKPAVDVRHWASPSHSSNLFSGEKPLQGPVLIRLISELHILWQLLVQIWAPGSVLANGMEREVCWGWGGVGWGVIQENVEKRDHRSQRLCGLLEGHGDTYELDDYHNSIL